MLPKLINTFKNEQNIQMRQLWNNSGRKNLLNLEL